MQIESSFCFETQEEMNADPLTKCNPYADPRVNERGQCVCAEPYSGKDCEQCTSGFLPIKVDPQVTGDKKAHSRCVLDIDHVSSAVCNGHGKPKQHHAKSLKEVTCDCDRGFSGQFCDFCADPTVAYPDCTEALSSIIYDPEETHAFLSRRRYDEHGYSTVATRYFKQGELEPTVFNEECGWVDFPDDLDKIEFAR